MGFNVIKPYMLNVLFVRHRQTKQIAVSKKGIHCLLTDCFIKNLEKKKHPLNLKQVLQASPFGLISKNGYFFRHSIRGKCG